MRFRTASIPRTRAACVREFCRDVRSGLLLSTTTTRATCLRPSTRLVNVLSLVKRVAPEAFVPPGSYNSGTLVLRCSCFRSPHGGAGGCSRVGGCSRSARIAGQPCGANRARLEITCKLCGERLTCRRSGRTIEATAKMLLDNPFLIFPCFCELWRSRVYNRQTLTRTGW